MISDAKKLFSSYTDKLFFSARFFSCENNFFTVQEKSIWPRENILAVRKKVLSLYQENVFLASEIITVGVRYVGFKASKKWSQH